MQPIDKRPRAINSRRKQCSIPNQRVGKVNTQATGSNKQPKVFVPARAPTGPIYSHRPPKIPGRGRRTGVASVSKKLICNVHRDRCDLTRCPYVVEIVKQGNG